MESIKNEKQIICFPGTLFDKEPFTNRQRVMLTLSEKGYNIIYVEPAKNPIVQFAKFTLGIKPEQKTKRWFKRLFNIEKRSDYFQIKSTIKIIPTKSKLFRRINNYINYKIIIKREIKKQNLDSPILWIYTPDAVDYANWIDHSQLVYDCVDEYSEQPWYRDNFHGIKEDEIQLLNKADLVFTSAESLYKEKRKTNENTYLLENVADFDHFNQVEVNKVKCSPDLDGIKGPKIGFIGAIDSYKLDLDLIYNMAVDKSNWNIILIGPIGEAEKAPDLNKIKSLPNIYILGPKKYDELPSYIKGFDVCVIPYQKNNYTQGCFPLKFFEYLASGKPVVTLGLPSLEKYRDYSVYTENYTEFINSVNNYLSSDSATSKSKRIELAKQNTWNTKVDKMIKLISKQND